MYEKSYITALVRKLLESDSRIISAYLFGSYAEGTKTENSDIDIAVRCSPGLTMNTYINLEFDLAGLCSSKLGTDKLDLLVINRLSSIELKHAIVFDGELIFSKDENNFIFEQRIIHEYWDHIAALKRNGLTLEK